MAFEEKELKAADVNLQVSGDTTLDLGEGKNPQIDRQLWETQELSDDPKIGAIVGNYEVIQYLGQGGMSVVYKGRHRFINRTVAIKMLRDSQTLDDAKLRRFHQEAVSVGRIDHPGIVKIYEFDIPEDGLSEPFLVMDYVDGQPLFDIIRKEGRIEPDECKEMIAQACDALQFAHNAGVVHRDIKPSNIMISRGDEGVSVKIVDFGIAKIFASDTSLQALTQTGEVFGSPFYMSPEQCLGTAIDQRSDIYSLGCVFYEALSGERPFNGNSALQTMHLQLHESPESIFKVNPALAVFPMLDAVFLKALAKDPADRYKTVTDFKEELLAALGGARKGFIAGAIDDLERFKRAGAAKSKVKFSIKLVSVVVAGLLAVGLLLGFALSRIAQHPEWKVENKRGQKLFDNGDFRAAEGAFKSALAVASGSKLDEDQNKISTLRNLQDLYAAQALESQSSQETSALAQEELRCRQEGSELANKQTLQDLSALAAPQAGWGAEKIEDKKIEDFLQQANNKAAHLINQGREGDAEPILKTCLQHSKDLRSPGRVRSLLNMSVVKECQGNVAQASNNLAEAYQLCRTEPSLKSDFGRVLYYQATIAFEAKDYATAEKLLQESIDFCHKDLGPNSDTEADAQFLAGRSQLGMRDNLLRQGNNVDQTKAQMLLDEAFSEFQSAAEQFKYSPQASIKLAEVQVYKAQALASNLSVESADRARDDLAQAIDKLEEVTLRTESEDAILGEALRISSLLQPGAPSARGAILRSLAIFKRLQGSQKSSYIESLEAYGRYLVSIGKPKEAENTLTEALSQANTLGERGELSGHIHEFLGFLKSSEAAKEVAKARKK